MRDFAKPGRPLTISERAMACTSHPVSSLAGLEILRSGGNAMDAALTAVAAQGVVEPHIGGDCFALSPTARAIWIDHDKGVLVGASDHRKDGMALGL